VASNQQIEVRVPDIGNYRDVEVIDVLVKPGDELEAEAPLITLETEKATMDVPSTAAGIVREVKVERGSKVSQGDLIVIVEAGTGGDERTAAPEQAAQSAGEEETARDADPAHAEAAPVAQESPPQAREEAPAPARPAPRSQDAATATATATATPAPDEPGFSRAHASPSIRKLARELGVDLARVEGTGTKGRITDQDVKAWVKRTLASPPASAGGSALPAVARVDHASFGPVERKPLSRIQKIAGPRLHASWVNVPHVTQFDEADITEMEQARAGLKDQAGERGIKLTPLAFVMRACVLALHEFPQFCASLDAEAGELVYKKYVHVGFAADTPQGLVVPVVRDADRKDVFELARDLAELSGKARAGKLAAAEMQGGCFTISSLGGIGGTAFTPIINAPEVAILGVSRSTHKPIYRDGGFVPRLMLPLSLSYDHRVIDGAAAVRFTTFLGEALADVDRLLRAIP
jgi:pyruvate dehydrogenase E2 component (dihydrolipoamide acetyltransferase)